MQVIAAVLVLVYEPNLHKNFGEISFAIPAGPSVDIIAIEIGQIPVRVVFGTPCPQSQKRGETFISQLSQEPQCFWMFDESDVDPKVHIYSSPWKSFQS